MLALELNDAALAVVDGSGLKALEPGYAVAGEAGTLYGTAALALLKRLPRQVSRGYWRFQADRPAGAAPAENLLGGHLARLLALGGNAAGGLVVAVPPAWSPEQLARFLDRVREQGVPLAGVVDAAVAATRSAHPGRDLLHLEAGLAGLWISRIAQGDGAALAGREALPGPGIEALTRVCTEYLARRFIESSRFDPLHDGPTEQLLFDQLPDWLARIGRAPETHLELTTPAGRFGATVSGEGLRARVGLACEPLLQHLRATVTARGPVALQVHSALAAFPGVLETLLRVPGALVRTLEPGAAARGALARLPALAPATGAAGKGTLVTVLPFDGEPVTTAAEAPGAAALRRPSHVLLGHRAWRLGADAFGIGTELSPGERGVALDPGLPGVSRHHCTIRPENGALMVFDHSRFGTFLNGHRVEGSAVLEPGDRLTLGSPPVELRFIAEAE